MLIPIHWRAAGLAVGLALVVGLVFGLGLNALISLVVSQVSSTDAALWLSLIGFGATCGLGLMYGVLVGGVYAWAAGRGRLLAASDAMTGAGVSVLVFVALTTGLNLCGSLVNVMLMPARLETPLGPETMGAMLVGSLFTALWRSLLELVTALITAIPSALVVARLTRRG